MRELPLILIFIDWYVPAYKAGGPIRSVDNLVKKFNNQFRFAIITSDTDYLSDHPLPEVVADRWVDYDKNIKVIYLSKSNITANRIGKLIKEEKYDKVYLNGLYSIYFTMLPLWLLRKELSKVVLAPRGMLSAGSLGVKSFKKKLFLGVMNMSGVFDKISFHATNSYEKEDIVKNIGSKTEVKIAPNLPTMYQDEWVPTNKEKGELKCIFLGRIAPEKNLHYAIERLRSLRSNIVLDIYGPQYDMTYWASCEKSIKLLPSNVTVSYHGILPGDQAYKTMKNYHCLFLPSTGENYGHAIVEAFSAGLPVIISTLTPWKNLESQKVGWDIPLDKNIQFEEAIEQLASMDGTEFNEWSKGAHSYGKQLVNDKSSIAQNSLLFS